MQRYFKALPVAAILLAAVVWYSVRDRTPLHGSVAPGERTRAFPGTSKAANNQSPVREKDGSGVPPSGEVPALSSPYLDLSGDSMTVIDWGLTHDAGHRQLEAIVELEDRGTVYLLAEMGVDGSWEVTQSAVAGQFVMVTPTLPFAEWQERGYLANGKIRIKSATDHLCLIEFPVDSLAEDLEARRILEASMSGFSFSRNGLVFPLAVPDDPGYANSSTLKQLDLEPVWERFGFSPEGQLGRRAIIAVVDSGAPESNDFHLWINEDEIPGNEIDDDLNGYIDDVSGFNFYRHSGDLSYAGGHGSTVSKIAASITNNGTGSASPASSAALMRILYREEEAGSLYAALAGIIYAAENGADAINCSWMANTGDLFGYVLDIVEDNNAVLVAAAGNNRKDLATANAYPARLPHPVVLSVGASDEDSELGNSNYSATLLDIIAPGGATSFSTPLVSSMVALLRALKPEASNIEIINAIIEGANPVPALEDLCVADGLLNAAGAVEALLDGEPGEGFPPEEPEVPVEPVEPVEPEVPVEPVEPVEPEEPVVPEEPDLTVSDILESEVYLTWTSPDPVDSYQLQYSLDGEQFLPLEPTDTFSGDTTGVLVEGLDGSMSYFFRMRALNAYLASDWTAPVVVTLPDPLMVPNPLHLWDFDRPSVRYDAGQGRMPLMLDLNEVQFAPGIGSSGSAIEFSLSHRGISVPDSETLNLGFRNQMTLSFWLKVMPEGLDQTAVIYEQGGYWRGLNILIEKGWLVVNGWNLPLSESAWSGTTLYGRKLLPETWMHVVVTLDAGESLEPDALSLYMNGERVATGEGSQLWVQGEDNGLGQVFGSTFYRDRQVLQLVPFIGLIDELAIWEMALDPEQVVLLYQNPVSAN